MKHWNENSYRLLLNEIYHRFPVEVSENYSVLILDKHISRTKFQRDELLECKQLFIDRTNELGKSLNQLESDITFKSLDQLRKLYICYVYLKNVKIVAAQCL